MKMQDKYGTEKSITFESRRTVEENPQVTFLFAPREAAGLAGMAGLYRAWLMEKEGLSRLASPQAKPLFLDIYGVSQKKESFLGFLVDRPATGTTVEELRAMCAALEQAGANDGVLTLYYWNKKGTAAGFSAISRWTDPSGAKRRSPLRPGKRGTGPRTVLRRGQRPRPQRKLGLVVLQQRRDQPAADPLV